MTPTELILQNTTKYFRFYFGLYLKQKRTSLGMNVEHLANSINMTPARYNRLEVGGIKITDRLAEKLDTVFRFDLEDIYELKRLANVAQANDICRELNINYPA